MESGLVSQLYHTTIQRCHKETVLVSVDFLNHLLDCGSSLRYAHSVSYGCSVQPY